MDSRKTLAEEKEEYLEKKKQRKDEDGPEGDEERLEEEEERNLPTKSGRIKIRRMEREGVERKEKGVEESGREVLGRDDGVKVRVSRIKTEGLPER